MVIPELIRKQILTLATDTALSRRQRDQAIDANCALWGVVKKLRHENARLQDRLLGIFPEEE